MTEAIAIRQPEWESKIELVKRVCAPGATDDELQLFFHQARRTGLDPLAKQIYCVKRAGKMAIQTGIDGYRLIADRTGQYAGNDDYEFDDAVNQPKLAKARVWKLVGGVRCPFEATARWEQYYPGDAQGFMWKKMPHVMLGKCAEALALRKAFPAELSGVYTADEMEQSGDIDAPSRHADKIASQTPANAVQGSSVPATEPLSDLFPDGQPCDRCNTFTTNALNPSDGSRLCNMCQPTKEDFTRPKAKFEKTIEDNAPNILRNKTVEAVNKKSGQSAKGDWVKWSLAIGQTWYSSFDEKIGARFPRKGDKVSFRYEKKGEYYTILEIL